MDEKTVLQSLISAGSTCIAGLLLYVLTKALDAGWEKRQRLYAWLQKRFLTYGATALIALFGGRLLMSRTPIGRADLFMGVLTAVGASIALSLRLLVPLLNIVERMATSPLSGSEKDR